LNGFLKNLPIVLSTLLLDSKPHLEVSLF
jgi:hypothetical protein